MTHSRPATEPPALELPRGLAQSLLSAAADAGKIEICGFVTRAGNQFTRYTLPNCAAQPAERFEMAPADQIAAFKHMRGAGETRVAIYHSHPCGEAVPSSHDRQGHGYPAVAALLIAPRARQGCVRAWRVTPALATPVRINWMEARWYNQIFF